MIGSPSMSSRSPATKIGRLVKTRTPLMKFPYYLFYLIFSKMLTSFCARAILRPGREGKSSEHEVVLALEPVVEGRRPTAAVDPVVGGKPRRVDRLVRRDV